jgi:hypothetical protein
LSSALLAFKFQKSCKLKMAASLLHKPLSEAQPILVLKRQVCPHRQQNIGRFPWFAWMKKDFQINSALTMPISGAAVYHQLLYLY